MTKEKLNSQFIDPKFINRVLIVVIFILALALGYYFTRFEEMEKKYNRLNLKYLQLQRN